MAELIIGTDDGVFALHPDSGKCHPENGPGSVRLLAPAGGTVYALASGTAVWQRAGHNEWSCVNEAAVAEEVWSLGADPQVPGLLYLSVSPAMLHRSTDGGRTWEACESVRRIPGYDAWTFPPPPHIPHVRSIAADPQEPGAVFIGVEEGGVYRSADGGRSWQGLNEGLNWDIHTVVPPRQGSRVFATTGYGFHRSDDAGGTWRLMLEGLDRAYTVPLIASVESEDVLYTVAAATPPGRWGTNATANAALYRSTDAGDHWHQLQEGLPPRFDAMVRSIVQGEDGTLFTAAEGAIYASADGGDTWTVATSGLPAVRALALV